MQMRVVWSVACKAALAICGFGAVATGLDAGQPVPPQSPRAASVGEQAIQAGEFAVVKDRNLPNRDAFLAQIATEQSSSGDTSGAITTMRQIRSADQRGSLIGGGSQPFVGANASGGGAFADFDSLMNLIQTTVVPDTWEQLGGNSTMAPYPQGVFVDASGTLKLSEVPVDNDALANLSSLLAGQPVDVGRWRLPAKLRCVSLRRLTDQIASRRFSGLPLGDELLNLAGVSAVNYVIFGDDDIVLAGPVGGIDEQRGWFVDRESGRAPLRSDFLARCMASALSDTPFGCTIDPTPQGLGEAAAMVNKIRSGEISIGNAAENLRNALGMQRIEVFGAPSDTGVGLLMVEADRHMKLLALGKAEMPEGVDNYLDAVDDFIAQGPPNGLLLRLWFTAQEQVVRCDSSKQVFEIRGNPIQLSGENQRALTDGQRGNVTVDPRSQQFVQQFNQNWNRIRDHYPIYGSLEALYRAAAVAQLIDTYGTSDAHRSIADCLAMDDSSRDWVLNPPKQVESIAAMHSVRHGGKRHHVVLASGGVEVQPNQLVASQVETYASLNEKRGVGKRSPVEVNHWWWDVK